MTKKHIIKRVSLRFYEGEEMLVEAISSLDDAVIVNEYLKRILREALLEKVDTAATEKSKASIDTQMLAKDLLPQIRQVVEAAIATSLAELQIHPNNKGDAVDNNTQEHIQDGLKQLGRSMM